MGALFAPTPVVHDPAPTVVPPPPPDQSDIEVQQAALAQAARMSSIGYKSAFKAGPRGDGAVLSPGGSAPVPTSFQGTTPRGTPGTPGQGAGGGFVATPRAPGETGPEYWERVKEGKRQNIDARKNRERGPTVLGGL